MTFVVFSQTTISTTIHPMQKALSAIGLQIEIGGHL